MGNIQSLQDIISIVRRRLLPILAISLVGTIATVYVALGLPSSYEASAVIQIEVSRVAEDSSATVATQIPTAQRLQLIEQRLMTRAALLDLIAAHGLFSDAPQMTESEKILALRRALRLENVTAGALPYGAQPAISALLITATMSQAQQAADVANDLANRLLAVSARRQSDRTRETLEFYALEEQRVGSAMAQLEAEITAFKNENIDSLPDGLETRRDEIIRLEERLTEVDLQLLNFNRERDSLLQNRNPRAIEQRQIDALDLQIASVQGQRPAILDRIAAVERSIARAPSVETMLGTFARRLSELQDQYSVINRRRAEAATSQRLEANQQAERFELLEPAVVPDYALSSGRKKVLVFGVFASILAALGVALIQEVLNPVLRSARQLERALNMRPVISIPVMDAPRHRSAKQ
ncbi:MAG: Wzz/FepE/Etk N-terminal domain-containing protein [Gemmobacter sp.]|nr:Wzz/FepE/Etk N-terminal domain-containing protein [Gemmobacter sp.]